MKKTILLIFFLVTIGIITPLRAQSFSTRKLAELGEYIPKKSLPDSDSIFRCSQILKEKSFEIKYNENNEISHLGVFLFNKETKEKINVLVCDFIERLALELVLQKNSENIRKKLKGYKISMEEQSPSSTVNLLSLDITILSILKRMSGDTDFFLQQNGNNYIAAWKQVNGKTFRMTFPASRELIFGTNKKESDEILSEQLLGNRCSGTLTNEYQIEEEEIDTISVNRNVFVKKGDSFILTEINSDIYMSKDVEKFHPLHNFNYPSLSLKNLLQTSNNSNTKIYLKHRMYGNQTSEHEMGLNNFFCFFQSDFKMYCHVEDAESDTLKATVILHNKNFNYIHLLTITTTISTLFQEHGILYAELYSNIPQHNIKSLFQTSNL